MEIGLKIVKRALSSTQLEEPTNPLKLDRFSQLWLNLSTKPLGAKIAMGLLYQTIPKIGISVWCVHRPCRDYIEVILSIEISTITNSKGKIIVYLEYEPSITSQKGFALSPELKNDSIRRVSPSFLILYTDLLPFIYLNCYYSFIFSRRLTPMDRKVSQWGSYNFNCNYTSSNGRMR